MTINLVILLAIAMAIAIGYVFTINIGMIAIGFAYLIGAFILGLTPSDLIAMWTTKLFFILFTLTTFYGFATTNGTLEKAAAKSIYLFRNLPYLIPLIIFLTSMMLGAIGAGVYAVVAFMVPIVMPVCTKTGMNRVLSILAIITGSTVGDNIPLIGTGGLLIRGIIEKTGYADPSLTPISLGVSGNLALGETSIVLVAYLLLKGWRVHTHDIEKPAPFTSQQRKNLCLIAAVMFCMTMPTFFSVLFPGNAVLSFLRSKMDMTLLAVVGAIIAHFLKLGDLKEITTKVVPWNTITVLCGMGLLIGVAVKAGTITMLASFISKNIPPVMTIGLLIVVAGIMSFFSSTLAVVAPTLFPIVPIIALSSVISPALLFGAIYVGSCGTGCSPFSSGGGIALASIADEKIKGETFSKLLLAPPLILVGLTILFVIKGILGV